MRCVEFFCTGQKYLLKELRSHLAQGTSVTLSQQLEKQLTSFDSRTRNYSCSLATEFLPPTRNCPAGDASTYVASGHLSPDFLVEFSPSASRTANSGNQHLPVADARHSEENTLRAGFDSPLSPGHNSAGGTYQYGASTPSYYSENESEADNDDTARHISDVDDDDEFDAYSTDERDAADSDEDEVEELYSDENSSIDEEYQPRGYDEHSHSAAPREIDTDSEDNSDDNRHLDTVSPRHRPSGREGNVHRRTVNEDDEDSEDDDGDDDGCDDLRQSQDRTGSSHTPRDEQEHGRCVEEDEQLEYAPTGGGEAAGLSDEQERPTLQLSQRSEGGADTAADAVQALPVDAVVGDNVPNQCRDMSDVNRRSLSSVDSDDRSQHNGADDNTDDDEEVFSPSSSPSYSHEDDNPSCDEDDHHRQSFRSRSRVSRPVSRCLSDRSLSSSSEGQASSPALEARNRHSSTASSGGHASSTSDSVDSDDDSDDGRTPADRRGVKRRRRHSDTSGTDTASDDTDRLATKGSHRCHKQHRFH